MTAPATETVRKTHYSGTDLGAEDQLVSQPANTVLWMCRRRDLRLVKVPRDTRFLDGRKVGETKGETVQFVNGRFDCSAEGTVTMEDGRRVDAAEVNAWLESHRLNGDVQEGFWRVDQQAPAPSKAELDQLMQAAYDEEKLELIIEQERAGWERDDIITVAEGALERLRALKAEMEAEQAAGGPEA